MIIVYYGIDGDDDAVIYYNEGSTKQTVHNSDNFAATGEVQDEDDDDNFADLERISSADLERMSRQILTGHGAFHRASGCKLGVLCAK